jgi:hypothetical protein
MTQDEINAVKKAAEKMRKQESAQDEIIEMARKVGLYQDINVSFHQALRNFYDLATAKEREAIYQLVMDAPFKEFDRQEEEFDGESANAMKAMAFSLTSAIRARGEQA